VRCFVDGLTDDGAPPSPSTVAVRLAAVGGVYNFAVRMRVIDINPALGVRRAVPRRSQPRDKRPRRRLHRILESAGLPQTTLHDLHHSCASLMLAQGLAPRVVMETLGHGDIRLTMNVYKHVAPELQRDAADRMERLIGG
jgi:integrase